MLIPIPNSKEDVYKTYRGINNAYHIDYHIKPTVVDIKTSSGENFEFSLRSLTAKSGLKPKHIARIEQWARILTKSDTQSTREKQADDALIKVEEVISEYQKTTAYQAEFRSWITSFLVPLTMMIVGSFLVNLSTYNPEAPRLYLGIIFILSCTSMVYLLLTLLLSCAGVINFNFKRTLSVGLAVFTTWFIATIFTYF